MDGSKSGLSVLFYFLAFLYFLLSIALVRLMFMGLPVRSFVGIATFLAIFAVSPKIYVMALWEMKFIVFAIVYAAFLSTVVSFFNDVPPDIILRQVLEIHIQAVICLLTGYGLVVIIGVRKLAVSFLAIVALSSVIAILQSVGSDPAWKIRDLLQTYQEYDADALFLRTRMRAMGLSFTPVHLGTQLCLAFALVFMLRGILYEKQYNTLPFHMMTGLALLLCIFVSVMSGNRSPILGFVVFIVAYCFYFRPVLGIVIAIFIAPIALNFDAILEALQETGIRAFRVGDKSSEGREALRAFGMLLFFDQPFGYGLSFKSTEHVADFWSQLIHYENAETVYGNVVHNYYLNILHKYGLLIFPVFLAVVAAFVMNPYICLAFIPYAVHIFYHNDGPLQSDFFIWYLMPYVILMFQKHDSESRQLKI